jgi:hypothetical protein
MKDVSDKRCRETRNTFYVQYMFPENYAAYEIMWKNIVQSDRPHTTVLILRIKDAICKPDN